MAKAAAAAPPETVALYEKLVRTNPKVERKGATIPYTSLNGNMFTFVTKEGVVALRLPADAREAFNKRYKAPPLVQYGVVMKEYVQVPAALLAKTKELKPFFDQSYAYALSLKPKPTKRK